jgi:DNA-binding CsgD family transcriptional regulator
LLDRAGALPAPQQAALGVALGLRGGAAPDRFLVGLATLNLLAEVAEERPLLCLVDDVQWLDQASAQVLAFVARRIAAEGVVLVFSLRDSSSGDLDPFSGLPELRLGGLDDADARTLLDIGIRTALDDDVCNRILAEARGNPLALLELPQSAEMAGGFEVLDLLSVPRRIEDSFQRRSAGLSIDTQSLLLVAAAEPTGDAALMWRAAEQLGIAREAVAPAEDAGLLEINGRVRFRHPLVRSAVYRAATPAERRRAHRALTSATDAETDPDRRAWHRGQSVVGTDEEAAGDLERSADRTRARGGVAAAAAFLQQAAELTPDPALRAKRALEAAHAKHEAGASETAVHLLSVAAIGPLDDLQRARLELLRTQITFYLTRGSDVPGMLLQAAQTLAPLDVALSRETYLNALDAAIITGGLSRGRSVLEVAEAALAAPVAAGPPRPADLFLDGLVMTYTQGYSAGVPGLRRALQTFRGDGPGTGADGGGGGWLWLASRVAVGLFDDELAFELAARNVRLARESGALATLPAALVFLSASQIIAGEFARASELAQEAKAISEATGAAPLRAARLMLAAWRGQQGATDSLFSASVQEATGRLAGTEVSLALYALAVLHNGLGNYAAAEDAAARASESDELPHQILALPELVEAASRAAQPERAQRALEELNSRAVASGTPWALGLAARSRGLTSTGPVAEEHYRQALEWLRDCRVATHVARTHLVYGEWLRREGRRHDAREQLRTAHELLLNMGAEAFAARAARELRATGEHPRNRTVQLTDALTDHELQIARLVATGATSREVGAQLFLSPRTIEAHLRSIFRKLGLTSRRQLKELQLP